MMSLEEELKRIQDNLSDPEFLKDYKKVAEASKRYAEIERMLNTDPSTSSGSTITSSVIVEIRAGAGGDEAALFCAQLFEMYTHYATLRGWQSSLIDSNQTSLGGYKQITFEVSGDGVLEELGFESGVHRVQRVPETEKSGRVHTSTVTVAVLPKAKETDFQINPSDLEVQFYRSGGPGGQNVNKVSTAVRLTHTPSGLTVTSQEERSQARNKEKALEILRTKLVDIKRQKEVGDIGQQRRLQIGTGDRSEKIRTYNFPQDRITDHRIKESWSNISKIMSGDMSKIVAALKEAQNKLISAH